MTHLMPMSEATHRRKRSVWITAWVLVVLGSLSGLNAQVSTEDWRLERLERVFQVTSETRVRVDNTWGDLAVRSHTRPEVYLLVNWQHHVDDERELSLEIGEDATELSVKLHLAATPDAPSPKAWDKRRADITVFVPEDATTSFSTQAGKLEVRGTEGPTEVRTTTGDIKLRIFGSARATTEHGNVLAQFRRLGWNPPVSIRGVTGRIRVELPGQSAVLATLETRGEVTSDFSMEVDRVPGSQLKHFRLQGGGPESKRGVLEIVSYSGPIQVVETLVSAEKGGNEE